MRIAIIGCGVMGRRRIKALMALGERDLLIHDSNWERQFNAGLASYILASQDIDEIWRRRPDAVLICTPPDSHDAFLAAAYGHGVRAMFVEKPLALSLPIYDYADCVTMVGANLRYLPGPIAVIRWLAEGTIGPVREAHLTAAYHLPSTRADYRTSYAATTGATLDVGSHMLDLALDWFGPAQLTEASVRPATSIGLPDIDGRARLTLRHDSGVKSIIAVAFDHPERAQTATIIGGGGYLDYSYEGRWASYRSPDGSVVERVTWGKEAEEGMYVRELDSFLGCVRDGRQTPNPISRASATLRILLEARGSWQPSTSAGAR